MQKLKERAPGAFNLLLKKYKYEGSTDAFFFDALRGASVASQVEGGSPGAPEMGFFGYELRVAHFGSDV